VTGTRRILVLTTGAMRAREALDRLAADGADVAWAARLGDTLDEAGLMQALDGSWAVVAGSEPYTDAVFAAAPSLRAVARFGAGYDAIDVEAATAHGVAVCAIPGANAEAVADLALGLMLACVRRIGELDRAVRAGLWRPAGLSGDLAGATVGIVGLGTIGRGVARRLTGFGCRLLAVDPVADAAFCTRHGIELGDLDAVLPLVDVLTLHAPLIPSTRHLLDARRLALVRPHAVVVNTARGPLIDQAALVDALREGRLAGAGLDVFEREPIAPDDPLLSLPNVVLTGHSASFTEGAARRMGAAVADQLRELLAGRLPAQCLNPEAWS
jgi:phosphoglycerate dehydrogenase-like enzyme